MRSSRDQQEPEWLHRVPRVPTAPPPVSTWQGVVAAAIAITLAVLVCILAGSLASCSKERPAASWAFREATAYAILIHGRLCPAHEGRPGAAALCAKEPEPTTRPDAFEAARLRYRALCLPTPPEGEVWRRRCDAYRDDLTQLLGEEP